MNGVLLLDRVHLLQKYTNFSQHPLSFYVYAFQKAFAEGFEQACEVGSCSEKKYSVKKQKTEVKREQPVLAAQGGDQ